MCDTVVLFAEAVISAKKEVERTRQREAGVAPSRRRRDVGQCVVAAELFFY